MANIVALSSGNFSNPIIWSTGTVPTTGDFVYANNRTILINTDVTCYELTNKIDTTLSPVSAAAGGVFNVLSSVNLFVDWFDTGATTLCQISANASPTIFGQINGGTVSTARGVDNLGTGTLTIVGLVSGGNGVIATTNFAEGVRNSSTGNIVLSGNAIGGVQASNHAIHNFGNGNVTVYGNLSGSTINTGQALRFHRGGNCTIYGNLYGLAGYGLVINTFTGDTNTTFISGNSFGPINHTGAGYAFFIGPNNGTTTIYGNIYGSQGILTTAATYGGQISQAAGNVYVYGNIYGGIGNGNSSSGLLVAGGTFASPVNFEFVGNLYGGHSPWGTNSHSAKHALVIDLANANLTCGEMKGGLNSLSNVRTFAGSSYALRVQGAGTIVNVTVPELRMEGYWYSPTIFLNNLQATLNITTNAYDDANTNQQAQASYNTIGNAAGILNFTGNIYGKDINVSGPTFANIFTNCAVYQGGANATINVTGQLIGGVCGTAIHNVGGITRATKVVGNRFGTNIIVAGQQASGWAWLGYGLTSKLVVEEIEAGTQGNFPAIGPIYMKDSNSKITLKQFTNNNLTQTMTDPLSASATYPVPSNVRNGISYAGGNLLGTCHVPSVSSVAYGVPVGNSTGQAILTIDNLLNFDVPEVGSNSIWKRLKNCSTVASTGDQMAALV